MTIQLKPHFSFINDANPLRYSMAALTGLLKDTLLVLFLLAILIFHNATLALLTIFGFSSALPDRLDRHS